MLIWYDFGMGDTGSGQTIQTAFGEFAERPGRVLVSTDLDPSLFKVPAAVSATGREMDIEIPRDTVIIGSGNIEAYVERVTSIAESKQIGGAENTALLNSISLLSSFTRASNITIMGNAVASSIGMGEPNAQRVNEYSGGLANISDADSPSMLALLTATPDGSAFKDVPKGYRDGLRAYIIAHEMEHLRDPAIALSADESKKDDVRDTAEVLNWERTADRKSLTTHFNKDFDNFIMDARALHALNRVNETDMFQADHATHISPDHHASGAPIAKTEADKIIAAPERIFSALRSNALSDEAYTSMLKNPESRYVAIAAARNAGDLNDIPYANQFADKYMAAAERMYKPERLESAARNGVEALAASLAYQADPDESLSEEQTGAQFKNDPSYRYANLKTQQELGVFKVYPQGDNIVNGMLADIAREHPDAAANYNRAEYRERYDGVEFDAPDTGTAPAARPQTVALAR